MPTRLSVSIKRAPQRRATTVQGAQFKGQITIRSASSRRLEPAARNYFLAAGDSASRFDPLSSQGIFNALRSGIFASYAIGDSLIRHNDSGLDRFRRFVLEEFKSYTEVRTKYYRNEQRWAESKFWLRRHTHLTNRMTADRERTLT